MADTKYVVRARFNDVWLRSEEELERKGVAEGIGMGLSALSFVKETEVVEVGE